MNMQSARSRQQAGFTLIELIVVIVILGILAATALPKFADLGGDARYAAIKGAKGAMEAAASMAHGKSLITGAPSTSVAMEGVSVPMAFGYPTGSAQFAQAAGLATTEWDITATSTVVTVKPKGLETTNVSCQATYTPPTAAGGAGNVALVGSADDC